MYELEVVVDTLNKDEELEGDMMLEWVEDFLQLG